MSLLFLYVAILQSNFIKFYSHNSSNCEVSTDYFCMILLINVRNKYNYMDASLIGICLDPQVKYSLETRYHYVFNGFLI